MRKKITVLMAGREEVLLISVAAKGSQVRIDAADAFPREGADQLHGALRQQGYGGDRTIVVLPPSQYYVGVLRLPAENGLSEDALRERINARVPIPDAQTAADVARAGRTESGKNIVVYGAARREVVEASWQYARSLGLVPVIVTPSAPPLFRMLDGAGGEDGYGDRTLLHVWPDAVDLVRVCDGEPADLRSIPLASGNPDGNLPDALRAFAVEAQLAERARCIYVSGAPEHVSGMSDRIEEAMKIRPEQLGTDELLMDGMDADGRELVQGRARSLAGAGAEVVQKGAGYPLNLASFKKSLKGTFDALRWPLRAAALLFLLVVVGWTGQYYLRATRLERRRRQVHHRMEELWGRYHEGEDLPVDPLRTLRSELTALSGEAGDRSGSPLMVLNRLRGLVAPLTSEPGDIPYREIRIFPSRIEVKGVAEDYATVEGMVQELEDETGLQADPPEMSQEGGRVIFRCGLRRKE